jgi:hypothetical protein
MMPVSSRTATSPAPNDDQVVPDDLEGLLERAYIAQLGDNGHRDQQADGDLPALFRHARYDGSRDGEDDAATAVAPVSRAAGDHPDHCARDRQQQQRHDVAKGTVERFAQRGLAEPQVLIDSVGCRAHEHVAQGKADEQEHYSGATEHVDAQPVEQPDDYERDDEEREQYKTQHYRTQRRQEQLGLLHDHPEAFSQEFQRVSDIVKARHLHHRRTRQIAR